MSNIMIKRFYLNKIVRNKYIEECEKSKFATKYTKLNNNEFLTELKNKIQEESIEVINTKNDNELIEEISDIYEIIDEILKRKNISKEIVLKTQKEKKIKRGSFEDNYFVEYSEFQKDCFFSNYFNSDSKYQKTELTMHIVDFIIEKDEKVFLQKRSNQAKLFPNQWELPGGKLEVDNETIKECIKRELKEELNLDLENIVTCVFDTHEYVEQIGYHGYSVYYIKTNGNLRLMEPEKVSNFAWISKNEIHLLLRNNLETLPYKALNKFFDLIYDKK